MHRISRKGIKGKTGSALFLQSIVIFLLITLTMVLLSHNEWGNAIAQPKPDTQKMPTEVEMIAVMEKHYDSAILSHDALIQGNLEALRRRLSQIETQTLPPAAPESWRPHHARLRKAARSAAGISSLEKAGPVMGAVAEACGACHAALGVGTFYYWPSPPDEKGGVEREMRTHQWATERLWEGVTGPFQEAWYRGAAALAEARVFGNEGSGVKNSLLNREAELRDLGRTAKATKGLHERAVIYGRLLTTCAGCHQEAGVSIKSAKPIPPWQE
ncbi:MAG: hypothetical protein OEV42_10045 [Deltaproteobacteria bacterium]|nr:hypothetical protein [Deltaproteobacteria bacterium]